MKILRRSVKVAINQIKLRKKKWVKTAIKSRKNKEKIDKSCDKMNGNIPEMELGKKHLHR